ALFPYPLPYPLPFPLCRARSRPALSRRRGDTELLAQPGHLAEVVGARVFLVEDVEILLHQAHAPKAVIALEAIAARHEVVRVAAVVALLTIGERAALAAALAVRQKERFRAFHRIARAITAHAIAAEYAIGAAHAVGAFDAANVYTVAAIGGYQPLVFGVK